MSHPKVRGVVVLTRNGDRWGYTQSMTTYKGTHTDATPLGEVRVQIPLSFMLADAG